MNNKRLFKFCRLNLIHGIVFGNLMTFYLSVNRKFWEPPRWLHIFKHSVLLKFHTSYSLKLFYCSQKWRWATIRAMKTLRAKAWSSSANERWVPNKRSPYPRHVIMVLYGFKNFIIASSEKRCIANYCVLNYIYMKTMD